MFSNPTLNISYSEPKYEGDESSVAASPFLPVKVFPHTQIHTDGKPDTTQTKGGSKSPPNSHAEPSYIFV